MSDEEEVYSEEEQSEQEEEESEEQEAPKPAPVARPAKKLELKGLDHLDEESRELLENNLIEREGMEAEIRELRERSEIRKKERAQEEKKLAVQRNEEDQARKAQEEDRRKKKDEEENKKREARQSKMEEFNKLRNATGPNFVITRKGEEGETNAGTGEEEADAMQGEKKTRKQLEHEKQVALQQRIKPLDIDDADMAKLQEKAKVLHKELLRIEGEKYDLEKRFKEQQYDMMELAERARNMNKVGKGGLKRIQMGADENDRIQDKIAGTPAKIEMYSKYERQKDKRGYQDRHGVFLGATWAPPIEKISAAKKVKWNPDTGLPEYEYVEGYVPPPEEEEEE